MALKKFSFRFLLLLAIVILLDIVIGNALRHYYFKQSNGEGFRSTYAIDSTKAELLIFGSSRANHHYVPEVFEDSLNMSYYNTGRDGNFILYNYAVFQAITSRYTPKVVIFDVNPDDIYFSQNSYDRLSSLLPYYQGHPEVRSIVNLRSPFERVKMLSTIYAYNSSALTIAMGNLGINKDKKKDNKGYLPLFLQMKDTALPHLPKEVGVHDQNVVDALASIAKVCKERNIKLLFIQSPRFTVVDQSESTKAFKEIIMKYGFNYYDYSNHPDFINNPKLFQDWGHLNHTGAISFSIQVASIINYADNKLFSKK